MSQVRPEADVGKALRCPRDGAAAVSFELSGVTLDQCPSCSGTFFDAKELRRLTGDRQVERLAHGRSERATLSLLRCPRCSGRAYLASIEGVEVDTCAECGGVWVDAGELSEARRRVETRRVMENAGPGFLEFLRKL